MIGEGRGIGAKALGAEHRPGKKRKGKGWVVRLARRLRGVTLGGGLQRKNSAQNRGGGKANGHLDRKKEIEQFYERGRRAKKGKGRGGERKGGSRVKWGEWGVVGGGE